METLIDYCMAQCVKILEGGNKDSGQQRRVAHAFLFLELLQLDPDFRELFLEKPEDALAKAGLALSKEEALQFFQLNPNSEYQENIQFSQCVCEYYAYFGERRQRVKDMREKTSVVLHPALERFRQCQINRCWHQMGVSNAGRVHVPLVFELSDGCSIGCPFCGVASEGLKSVFRATPDNKKLFGEILDVCEEIMGKASGEGTLYYASEPLDNPDYEIFADVFFSHFDKYPQITTAAAMRHPDRVKRILKKNMSLKNPSVHRFSVLTIECLRNILEYFSPEELLYVELLGKYPEAQASPILNAGRAFGNRKSEDEYTDSICCISGFVVNMARRSLRLITACPTDRKHPCGEIIYEEINFSDAEDFKEKLISQINKYMPISMPMNVPFGIYRYLEIRQEDAAILIKGRDGYSFQIFPTNIQMDSVKKMLRLLGTGTLNCRQILQEMAENTKEDALLLLVLLRKLYDSAIIAPIEEIER